MKKPIYRPEEVKCWLPRRPEKMVSVEIDGSQTALPIDVAHHLHLNYQINYWRI